MDGIHVFTPQVPVMFYYIIHLFSVDAFPYCHIMNIFVHCSLGSVRIVRVNLK